MNHISSTFNDPRPRTATLDAGEINWNYRRAYSVGGVHPPGDVLFTEVLSRRRSSRDMQAASLREVINVVYYVSRPRFESLGDSLGRYLAVTPSAGALHPIQILIVDFRGAGRVFHLDSRRDLLFSLPIVDKCRLKCLHKEINDLAAVGEGTALIFAADLRRTDSVYENAHSLVWRDAGALLQSVFLVASAYNLAFCPLGILGAGALLSIGLASRLTACGIAMVGRTPVSK